MRDGKVIRDYLIKDRLNAEEEFKKIAADAQIEQ